MPQYNIVLDLIIEADSETDARSTYVDMLSEDISWAFDVEISEIKEQPNE